MWNGSGTGGEDTQSMKKKLTEEDVEGMKVKELQVELRKRFLPITGRNKVLKARLKENIRIQIGIRSGRRRRRAERYELKNGKMDIEVQKSGWYQMAGRTHSYYSGSGNFYYHIYVNRGKRTSQTPIHHYRGRDSTGQIFECHTWGECLYLAKGDTLSWYTPYGSPNNAAYGRVSLEPITDLNAFGTWRSRSGLSNYLR